MFNDNKLRLQSILLPTEDVCNVKELYYHKGDNEIKFDGYFNLFAIDKWRKYTKIDNLHLHIMCKGFKKIKLMCKRKEIKSFDLNFESYEYDIVFPYDNESYDSVFWISLIPDEEEKNDIDNVIKEVKGYFYTEINKEEFLEINIVGDICTFKREQYILRNITKLRECILENDELEVKSHFEIYIVDNGKTLSEHREISEIINASSGQIKVFPNKNAGGAGGFTRGMIEALKAKTSEKLTHLLIMDDDAVYEPDSIVRLYALLKVLKPEWRDAAVGGSVMREDYKYILHESGPSLNKWKVVALKDNNDERLFENASSDYIMKPYGEFERYSAWCFCCFPLTTINEYNLPIPIFVHYDDIEYGIRNQKKGLITLNGIGVWHKPFGLSVTSMNAYIDTRNKLISMALYDESLISGIKGFINEIAIPIFSYMVRYRYSDVKLIEKAIEDFLRGPDFLRDSDPEGLLHDIGKASIRMTSISDTKDLNQEEKIKVEKFISDFSNDRLIDMTYRNRNRKLKFQNFLPMNRFRFKILSVAESPYNFFGYKKIVYVEPYTNKIFVGKRNLIKMVECAAICFKCGVAVAIRHKKAEKEYKKKFPELITADFWNKYLDLCKNN